RAAIRILEGAVKRRKLRQQDFERQKALVSGSDDWVGFGGAEVVIEAVFEDLGVKREVLADIARNVAPDAVIASNTSTIPIGELAQGVPHPERVIGMHFFSP